mgnify:CR=1 FL=1
MIVIKSVIGRRKTGYELNIFGIHEREEGGECDAVAVAAAADDDDAAAGIFDTCNGEFDIFFER